VGIPGGLPSPSRLAAGSASILPLPDICPAALKFRWS